MNRLSGTGVALVTPFTRSLEIDFEALGRLMDYTQSNGVDYYVVMGTTGETATLSPAEKAAVLNFVRENNRANLPIVYGLGGNNTAALLSELKNTELSGIDALLSVSPYYNKPSQRGIVAHYEQLANEAPIPVILYNVPGRTASNVTAASTLILAHHPNIIGIKEAAGDMDQVMRIARDKPEDFLLISGDDLLTLPMMSVGGTGVISVLANAIPNTFQRMMTEFRAGNVQGAALTSYEMLDLNPLMYEESNPVGVKFVLSELGICEPHVRLPLFEASESLKARIREILHKM
ncbi:4-hydroxy-tetrahydrodipicolinate synthase [Fulvivirga sp. 1062]|uniref:4-hydroxy-tetrahydrodipicolinate synthase n=2 Tax=Fulvivirga sedimenti TaxID=2879465 RepID=A0A9X1L0B9_9BACT|nr:4-hydroxy-tetrahydrodipicolinate synthase [Fulvivirga sedimenti]MCA6074782.1 4-hydroxy-tetrahydrodipicolinate synthase [Fulvivirga sedimenti]MCA6075959.1 4-hydroxy-tetrahydrodipicolinate synthase [Fulvivirga sedimenti]MCA6077087.1 4-hydroxy-tetrahydrodipicolinate synthase [Fulvivirga sedimenti]